MQNDAFDQALEATLDDRLMSRGERRALRELFADLSDQDRSRLRARTFELARRRAVSLESRELIDWLEEAVKTSLPRSDESRVEVLGEARFSPGPGCLERITQAIRDAEREIDICVFTITDDRITKEIIAAKRRGVSLRIITDNEKAMDLGSDVDRLESSGVELRVDETEHHMHHKFAVFDRRLLLTGSYNWTRSAADHNLENIVLTDHRELVGSFSRVFDQLWNELA